MKRTICLLMLLSILITLCSCSGDDNNSSADVSPSEEVSIAESNEESSFESEESTFVKEEPGFIIIKDGELLIDSIMISDSPRSTELTAANDLKNHLKKITGHDIKIVAESKAIPGKHYFAVGNTKKAAEYGIEKTSGFPGEERVIVKQDDIYLFLLGNDDGNYTGTEYAVTMFLESLGCGWFGEDELWQVIPELDNIDATNMSIDHTARFSSRITRAYEQNYSVAKRWYLGGNGSLTGHWLFQIAPASMYSEHPEWYALTNGSRNPAGYDYFQFCYSNSEFAEYVAEKLIKYYQDHPTIISMTIAYNDGWDEHFCECENCKSLGNQSDCLVNFANKVAKIVGKVYPDRSMQIYAYHMTYNPPENHVALEPNVELMLCRETSMTHPLDEDYFKAGKDATTRNTYTRSWRENALEWIEKTECKNVSVWEWYCLSAGDQTWQRVPWVQGNVATRNQDLWESMGVKYVYYDQGPLSGYFEDVSSFALRWPLWYVSARSAWGSDMTGEELLLDACKKLFGNAANEMFAYYQKLAEASEKCTGYSMTWVPPKVSEMYKAYKNEINDLVEKAKSAMENCTETEKKRIENQLGYWTVAAKLYLR